MRQRISETEKKLHQKVRQQRFRAKMVNLGDEVERWNSLKSVLGLENDSLAKLLMDHYVNCTCGGFVENLTAPTESKIAQQGPILNPDEATNTIIKVEPLDLSTETATPSMTGETSSGEEKSNTAVLPSKRKRKQAKDAICPTSKRKSVKGDHQHRLVEQASSSAQQQQAKDGDMQVRDAAERLNTTNTVIKTDPPEDNSDVNFGTQRTEADIVNKEKSDIIHHHKHEHTTGITGDSEVKNIVEVHDDAINRTVTETTNIKLKEMMKSRMLP